MTLARKPVSTNGINLSFYINKRKFAKLKEISKIKVD
jgi:hypothetical protein